MNYEANIVTIWLMICIIYVFITLITINFRSFYIGMTDLENELSTYKKLLDKLDAEVEMLHKELENHTSDEFAHKV